MSRIGKVSLIVSGVSLCILWLGKLLLGEWAVGLWIPVIMMVAFFVFALVKDKEFYLEFLTMRTTKHGMNMGAMILLVLLALGAVNYIFTKNDKKWDITKDKLNSLSDQSIEILKKLDGNIQIKFLYRSEREHAEVKQRFKSAIDLYHDENKKIDITYINTTKEPGIAEEFKIKSEPNAMGFVIYKDKKIRFDDFSEEAITTALVRATRTSNKKIYFVHGHGERDSEGTDALSVSQLKQALVDMTYTVASINLIEKQGVPQDADALIIPGPKQEFLATEIDFLKKYLSKGGRIFLALDPENRAGLQELLATSGIIIEPDYVLDQAAQLVGASAAVALGMSYSSTSEITHKFGRAMSLFPLASSMKKVDKTPEGLNIEELVKTSGSSVTTDSIASKQVKIKTKGPHTLMMSSQGTWPGNKNKTEETNSKKGSDSSNKKNDFVLVVSSDSDFLSNDWLPQQLNRDLALNAIAYLVRDSELISIRPKQTKGVTIAMTRTQGIFYFLTYLSLPLLLFVVAGVIWFRRRGA